MAPRVPIKVKSAVALAVPLVILLAVAGLEVARSARDVRDVREQTDLATAAIGPSGAINAIQNERNYTGLWLLGAEHVVNLPVDSIEEARRATDAAVVAFRDEVARKGGDVARVYSPALAALDAGDGLAAQRELVDSYDGARVIQYNDIAERSFFGYSDLVTALTDPTSRVTSGIDDEDLRRGVQLIDLASREVDRIAQFVRFALVASVTGDQRIAGPDEVAEAARAQSAADRGHLHILELATGTYRDLGEELRVESDATGFIEISADVVRTGDIDVAGMLEAISISDDESYYGFLHDVSDELRERADGLNSAALSRQRWFMALAWLVLAVALVATPLMTRSITRPLRSLTLQAKDVAERRLPQAVLGVHETPLGEDVDAPELEPVSVAGRDEVADVAAMLNRVQSRALELAVGQAVLRRNVADAFANLARRNQSLLGRQLDFITELEADEARPDALANLFRLDHHATRMRRNAESLLVLAGAEQRRHATAPAPLMDVVRAALSEVDDFPRVAFRNVAPATVAGPAVADLAHLLAELIENALRFSPPDRPVEISGQARTDAYLVTIADSGLGMGPDEIARANRRLAQAEDFTIAPSRYLGHYVAAALAARHGVGVALHPSPLSGITATVHLPSLLLVAAPGPGAGVDPGPEAMARPGRVTAALSGAGSGTRPRVEAGVAGFDRQGAGGLAVVERPSSSRAGDLYRLLTDLSSGVRRGQQDVGGGVVPGR